MSLFKKLGLGCLLISAFSLAQICAADDSSAEFLNQVKSVIQQADTNIQSQKQDNRYWNMPSYLGTHFISQYYLILKWLGRTSPALDTAVMRIRLLGEQLPDGSWYAIPDKNIATGDINATILNYWALKVLGEDPRSAPLAGARAFILAHGGLEKSSHFTKAVLALFHNYSWNEFPNIPYVLFTDLSPVNSKSFGQWIAPHLMPIAYFKKMAVFKDLGQAFNLNELWSSPEKLRAFESNSGKREFPSSFSTDRLLMDKILEGQQPAGSFGGYTVATLFSSIALEDFSASVRDYAGKAAHAMDRGMAFADEMYFGSGDSAYRGVTDDGRYWDTALLGIASEEAEGLGSSVEKIAATGEYLLSIQTPGGGFPFGLDFAYAPDTDDTAEIILFLSKAGDSRFISSIHRAVKWLTEMQNDDGGWGAFDRNNTGNFILRAAAKDFEDSADLFDESSPDVTGHILEALASQGYNSSNSRVVKNAIGYLKSSQEKMGAWMGRWGINYLYGTGAVLVGLLKAGESPDAPYIQKAFSWLMSRQNPDGGFGESTRSYLDENFAGVGISTPSQTAWAMLAFVESGMAEEDSAKKAAQYLVKEFESDRRWIDSSTVGTGHPGVVYMNYPSYPYAFPLIALTRYARAIR